MMVPLQAEVTRETFWQIGPTGKAVFYYLAVVSILVLLVGVARRVNSYRAASEDPFERVGSVSTRLRKGVTDMFSNRTLFSGDTFAGLWHIFVFWGFLTLLIATTILAIDIDLWRPLTGESFFVGDFYLSYSFIVDAMGLLFVIGIGVAVYRRHGLSMERLWGAHSGNEDVLFLWTLFVLGVGGYAVEALRILGQGFPSYETVSFVGWGLASAFSAVGVSEGMATAAYPAVWWSHAVLAFGFVAWLPYGKPFHMIASGANLMTGDDKAGVRLPGVPADASPDEIGPSTVEDFSWKQTLDQDACTKCGRCSSACPANASGRPLDPRKVILDIKEYREGRSDHEGDVPIVADGGTSVIDASTMESCMSCMACMEACPVDIEHLTHFTDMNRRLTESGQMDDNVQDAMMNVFREGNTFGESARTRPEWTEELDFEVPDARDEPVEYLWYVGDYPSYDGRNREVATALARVFHEADIDYGILYEDEQTDGNDVRRVGEEGLYEQLVEENSEAIGDCEFDTIVCTDPHSFNTFKNEYPEFEACDWGEDDVAHYTQVVEELVETGQLRVPDALEYTVTYHDPCHLGRYNGEYEAPRKLVQETGCNLHEMPRNRDNSYCCGGGGGGLWLDHEEEEKPSEERLREALEDTDAGDAVEKFVVACPMCMTMYEDGRKTGGYEDDIEIVGTTELLAEALTAS
ncbi:MAG: Fe-S oxidoreductase/nitrate reductase gamma subunit [Salinirussus sp.]|jgi:Fe-S oxidoreductase/nitrate reductase gamma subunit